MKRKILAVSFFVISAISELYAQFTPTEILSYMLQIKQYAQDIAVAKNTLDSAYNSLMQVQQMYQQLQNQLAAIKEFDPKNYDDVMKYLNDRATYIQSTKKQMENFKIEGADGKRYSLDELQKYQEDLITKFDDIAAGKGTDADTMAACALFKVGPDMAQTMRDVGVMLRSASSAAEAAPEVVAATIEAMNERTQEEISEAKSSGGSSVPDAIGRQTIVELENRDIMQTANKVAADAAQAQALFNQTVMTEGIPVGVTPEQKAAITKTDPTTEPGVFLSSPPGPRRKIPGVTAPVATYTPYSNSRYAKEWLDAPLWDLLDTIQNLLPMYLPYAWKLAKLLLFIDLLFMGVNLVLGMADAQKEILNRLLTMTVLVMVMVSWQTLSQGFINTALDIGLVPVRSTIKKAQDRVAGMGASMVEYQATALTQTIGEKPSVFKQQNANAARAAATQITAQKDTIFALTGDGAGGHQNYLRPDGLLRYTLMTIIPLQKQAEAAGILAGGTALLCIFVMIVVMGSVIVGLGQYIIAVIEFNFVAVMSILFIPLGAWHVTRDLALKTINTMIANALKTIFITIIIGMTIGYFYDMSSAGYNGTLAEMIKMVFTSVLFLMLSMSAPHMAAGMMSGSPALSSGDIIKAGKAVGQMAMASVKATDMASKSAYQGSARVAGGIGGAIGAGIGASSAGGNFGQAFGQSMGSSLLNSAKSAGNGIMGHLAGGKANSMDMRDNSGGANAGPVSPPTGGGANVGPASAPPTGGGANVGPASAPPAGGGANVGPAPAGKEGGDESTDKKPAMSSILATSREEAWGNKTHAANSTNAYSWTHHLKRNPNIGSHVKTRYEQEREKTVKHAQEKNAKRQGGASTSARQEP